MDPRTSLRILAAVSILGVAVLAGVRPTRALSCEAPPPSPAYTIEVLVDGRPLPEYTASGAAYIEAAKGREYAIRLTNRTGERVAAALAVDGLNTIDARHTTAVDARKWILGPWETMTLSGWQTSSGTARRFVFTTEPASYGAWLGKTGDLGVISAAFFRERPRRDEIAGAAERCEPMMKKGAADAPEARAKDELAATGIGREVAHPVVQVDFDEEPAPASTVTLRYEYHDALVRLGVISDCGDALARRERARGFAEPGFAPDPFRGGR
jgi:hypothetical protein